MWPFRKRRPALAKTEHEIGSIIASAIDAEIAECGVEALSEVCFALNPDGEIIVVRGSFDLSISLGLLPDGAKIAAVASYPDLLQGVQRAFSFGRLPGNMEISVDFLAASLATALTVE